MTFGNAGQSNLFVIYFRCENLPNVLIVVYAFTLFCVAAAAAMATATLPLVVVLLLVFG